MSTHTDCGSDVAKGIRYFLLDLSGGLCYGCGSAVGDYSELCHIVPSNVKRGGLITREGVSLRNAYAGCKACNTFDRDTAITPENIVKTLEPWAMALINIPFPSIKELRALGRKRQDEIVGERHARRAGRM